MLSALRKRMSYANIVATLALLFAMSGGALAASHYLITSTKQIKPSVLASLKGRAGAAGKAGPAGPAGPSGLTGAQGAQGATGAKGDTGSEGPSGKEGAPGKEGKEGSPWTAGGKLPKKATETGAWSAVTGPGSSTFGGESLAIASIGFTLPLAHPPHVKIEISTYDGSSAECPSSVQELTEGAIARAAPGVLCVYVFPGEAGWTEKLAPLVESPNGVVLDALAEESFAGTASYGVWAVTAE